MATRKAATIGAAHDALGESDWGRQWRNRTVHSYLAAVRRLWHLNRLSRVLVVERAGLAKMLSHGAARRFGAYQYAVMAAVTGLGFVGAPWWMAFIAAVLLFGSVAFGHEADPARAGGVQAAAEPSSAVFTLAAMSAGFAVACFAGGNVLAAIMLR